MTGDTNRKNGKGYDLESGVTDQDPTEHRGSEGFEEGTDDSSRKPADTEIDIGIRKRTAGEDRGRQCRVDHSHGRSLGTFQHSSLKRRNLLLCRRRR